jgi:8-oxo-dGTP pyrophosphatase MutT (NUDIX family)
MLKHPPNANMTVATTVCDEDGRFLIVEERPLGKVVLNQPAGHWEPGETLIKAAHRETLEESGWDVTISAFLGFSVFAAPNGINYCRASFVGTQQRFRPEVTLDTDISAVYWLSHADLLAQRDKMRSPMVLKDIDRYLSGKHYPLDMIYHQV